jgi:hypothetical protein
MQLQVELPKWPVGTDFLLIKGRDDKRPAKVIGYHVEHDTDTGHTNVTYRIEYSVAGQRVTANVARATLDRAPKPSS